MASTTFTVIYPALTGTAITAKAGVVSSDTLTIAVPTAAGVIDGPGLMIRCANTNSTAAITLSIGVGTVGSSKGIGAASVSVATETTVLIGGPTLDTSRFQTTAGTIVITQAGAGPTSWEVFQPRRSLQ